LIDAGIGAAAESADLAAPPSAPSIGQCWIVGEEPTGAWEGRAGALACWSAGGWRFLPNVEGLSVWIKDQQLWAVREATGWAVGLSRAAQVVVGGVQVLGSRGAPVAAPSGGSVIDAEARAALAAILDRLVAHGLMDA
jgi:hypothetical protein